MKRTITIVFLSFVLTALLLLAAWAGYHTVTVRKENIRRINDKVGLFNETLSSGTLSEKGSATTTLRELSRDLFAEEGRLQSLVVYSRRDGIIFKNSLSDNRDLDRQIDALPERLLPPTLKLNGFFHFSRTGEITDAGGSKLYTVYVFESLGRADIVFVLQIALVVVVALTLLTLIMILVTSRMGSNPQAERVSRPVQPTPAPRKIRRAPDPEPDIADGESFDLDDFPEGGEDSFDLNELPDGGDFSSSEDDFNIASLDDDDSDNLLKQNIPDIPEEEDLRAMDHERSEPSSFEMDDDFDLPSLDDSGDGDFSLDGLEDLTGDELEELGPSGGPDITEIEPSDQSLYSPRSGFCREAFLSDKLRSELDRAETDDEELLMLLFRDTGPETGDDAYRDLAILIRGQYPYEDLNFEYRNNGFAVLVQNHEMEPEINILGNLLREWNERNGIQGVRIGLSARCGRQVDPERMRTEAESSLSKTSDENPIVGFRPDPEKYLRFMAKNPQDT